MQKGQVLRGAESPPAGSMRLQGLAKVWRTWEEHGPVPELPGGLCTHISRTSHYGCIENLGGCGLSLLGCWQQSEKVVVTSESWGSLGVVSWEESHSPMSPRGWSARLRRLDSQEGSTSQGRREAVSWSHRSWLRMTKLWNYCLIISVSLMPKPSVSLLLWMVTSYHLSKSAGLVS